MKKYIVFLCILAALLTACKPVSDPENDAAGSNGQSASQPDATDDSLPSVEALTEEERLIAEFDKLFGTPGSWHQIALYSQYKSVDKLEYQELFCNGFTDEEPITDEEWGDLKDYFAAYERSDVIRLPATRMNEVVRSIFGISLEELNPLGSNCSTYMKRTDCYYMVPEAAGSIQNYKTTNAEKQEDGTLRVTYTAGAENTAYVVTVAPDGNGGYYVKSNLAVEPKPGTDGYPFAFSGTFPELDLSDGAAQSLYYKDHDTEEVYFVCEGTMLAYVSNETHVFYVKAEEPTKIYASPKSDFTHHTVIYESDFGDLGSEIYVGTMPFENDALQFVVGNKRLIWLDLNTMEASVVMEQFYLSKAIIDDYLPEAVSWTDFRRVYFEGKLSEGDELREYYYAINTGQAFEITM